MHNIFYRTQNSGVYVKLLHICVYFNFMPETGCLRAHYTLFVTSEINGSACHRIDRFRIKNEGGSFAIVTDRIFAVRCETRFISAHSVNGSAYLNKSIRDGLRVLCYIYSTALRIPMYT